MYTTNVIHCKRGKADIYIGRGSRFGNPFPMKHESEREMVIAQFAKWIERQPELLRLSRAVLKGKSLGCYCAPKDCHGDILAAIAEGQWDHKIPEKPYFVYGSNLLGINGAGAAKIATSMHLARNGIGQGFNGHAYAIATKESPNRRLRIDQVHEHVQQFIYDAKNNPEKRFYLTKIGRGLEGFDEQEILPLFKDIPDNVLAPGLWLNQLGKLTHHRIIVAGGRNFNNYDLMRDKLDELLRNLRDKPIEIVSGGAQGADTLGERYAIERGLSLRRLPALWEELGKRAGQIRNVEMAHYGTHLVAFWDGVSTGTENMISIAKKEGLKGRVVRF